MEKFHKNSIERASKAMKCLAFNYTFYKSAQITGLSAEKVFELKEKFSSKGRPWFRNPDEVENDFCWLIVIGVLRREVDGQGLTSRVKLTPLGRQIIEKTPLLMEKKVFILEKIKNCIFRKAMFK
tara:strand:- start:538 stop:912 length:375 start_codon:yes stop_codon:yes gene_type:complete